MDFDKKWDYFLKYDEATQRAVEIVKHHGSSAVDEIKNALEAFGDSSRLPKIASIIDQKMLQAIEHGVYGNQEDTLMTMYGIQKDGEQYVFKNYRYDKLQFAVDYAEQCLESEAREAEGLLGKAEIAAREKYGKINPVMVCPHCQTKGKVRTKSIEKKVGISGGKATAAVLTAGWSLPATGLSRTEGVTQAHCDECNNTWSF